MIDLRTQLDLRWLDDDCDRDVLPKLLDARRADRTRDETPARLPDSECDDTDPHRATIHLPPAPQRSACSGRASNKFLTTDEEPIYHMSPSRPLRC